VKRRVTSRDAHNLFPHCQITRVNVITRFTLCSLSPMLASNARRRLISRARTSGTRSHLSTDVTIDKYVRLNNFLAEKSGLSRREAKFYLEQGWVRVNGAIVGADQIGQRICPFSSQVELLRDALEHKKLHGSTTVILHKPLGVLSGIFGELRQKNPLTSSYVPAIKLLTKENMYRNYNANGKPDPEEEKRVEPYQLEKFAPAGRLDINSTGLLLFTQCGKTASAIIGPNSTLEKEYIVRLNPVRNNYDDYFKFNNQYRVNPGNHFSLKEIYNPNRAPATAEEMAECLEKLRNGITCSGEFLEAKSVELIKRSEQLRIVLLRGKKHHIRRMLEGVGWKVHALKRVRIGNVVLGSLPLKKWRYLRPHETVM
jgi:23S rRNA pseudouridine2604 synthase